MAPGTTTLHLRPGKVRALGVYLVIGRGLNDTVIETTQVTAVNARGESLTVTVTFQGQIGEQQFVGFHSRSPLLAVSFGVGEWAGGTSVIAIDDLTVGE